MAVLIALDSGTPDRPLIGFAGWAQYSAITHALRRISRQFAESKRRKRRRMR